MTTIAASGKHRELIYLLAPSYTGSTLLTFLLAGHPHIATVGELRATARGSLDTYRCSCGSLQRECGFWKAVTQEMRGAGLAFTLDDFGTDFRAAPALCNRLLRAGVRGWTLESLRSLLLHGWPSGRRCLEHILEQNRQIIEIICRLQQKAVFLDGSKEPIRFKLLRQAPHWNLKAIYLIRDGRGATYSYMRHHHTSMEAAATEWCRTHRECDRIIQGLTKEDHLTVHYERLCAQPQDTLAKIYGFLGLSGAGAGLQFRSFEHHILGNEMRLKSLEEIQMDEKWKVTLTRNDLDVFERVAGGCNRDYGYE